MLEPEAINWPNVVRSQRMYVGRPASLDWRDALRDHWDVMAGKAERPVWSVAPWTFRKGDLLVTYMQTRPAMVVFLEEFYKGARGSSEIHADTIALFRHGVPLGLIADQTGIDLTEIHDDYLGPTDAQAVIDVLEREHRNDTGVFGDSRISDLI